MVNRNKIDFFPRVFSCCGPELRAMAMEILILQRYRLRVIGVLRYLRKKSRMLEDSLNCSLKIALYHSIDLLQSRIKMSCYVK